MVEYKNGIYMESWWCELDNVLIAQWIRFVWYAASPGFVSSGGRAAHLHVEQCQSHNSPTSSFNRFEGFGWVCGEATSGCSLWED